MSAAGHTIVQRPGLAAVAFAADSEAARELATLVGSVEAELFTPTEAELLAAEAGLPDYLQRAAPRPGSWDRRAPVWARRGDYVVQYVGVVRGGRRVLLGHGFLREWDRPDLGGVDWREGPHYVCDGGYDVFHFAWDVAAGVYSGYMANGEA